MLDGRLTLRWSGRACHGEVLGSNVETIATVLTSSFAGPATQLSP